MLVIGWLSGVSGWVDVGGWMHVRGFGCEFMCARADHHSGRKPTHWPATHGLSESLTEFCPGVNRPATKE